MVALEHGKQNFLSHVAKDMRTATKTIKARQIETNKQLIDAIHTYRRKKKNYYKRQHSIRFLTCFLLCIQYQVLSFDLKIS